VNEGAVIAALTVPSLNTRLVGHNSLVNKDINKSYMLVSGLILFIPALLSKSANGPPATGIVSVVFIVSVVSSINS
jgi:hypothetical protein